MNTSSFDIVSKAELDEWIARPEFAAYFPSWIEGLVRAEAGDSLLSCDFATDEEAARHGYDGTTTTSSASENVPEGPAVWELGKGGDARAKAKKEYLGKLKKLGSDAKDHTFIFVTPRPFPQKRRDKDKRFNEETKQDWERARSKEGKFKEVRIIDQSQLRKWSAKHLAVGLHLCRHFNSSLRQGDVELPADYLDRFMARFKLAGIDEQILLCGRGELAARIATYNDLTKPLDVIANSTEEAVAVVAAALMTVENEAQREERHRNTLVVLSASVLKHMKDRRGLCFIVLGDVECDVFHVQPGNLVILCRALDSRMSDKATVARDPGVHSLREYLDQQGLEDGEKLAAMAGGAIASLQRLTGTNIGASYLETNGLEKQAILFAALLGGWSEEGLVTREETYQSLDVELIGDCLAKYFPFELFKIHLAAHTDRGEDKPASDTLLKRVGEVFWVKAPVDALDCILNELENEHYEIFANILIRAFSGDGEVDINPENAFGQKRAYSDPFKRGLALNFCILAYRGAQLNRKIKGVPLSLWVAGVFERLMEKVDFFDFIQREQGLLGYFAEGSPEVFMDALENRLQGMSHGMSQALSVENAEWSPFQKNNAAGLMWALMRLAWYPSQFDRVVRVLVTLHVLDPDKDANYSPRPATVFCGLFIAFAPQTSLPWEERMKALEHVPSDNHDALFELIKSALPHSHMAQTSHPTPIFGPNSAPEITYADLFAANDALYRKALEFTKGNAERSGKLVETLGNMSDGLFQEAMDQLEQETTSFSPDARTLIWKAVHQIVVRHSRFPEADWSMPKERLKRLSSWEHQLEPSLKEYVEYLFSASWIEDYSSDGLTDPEALMTLRAAITSDLIEREGFEAVIDLSRKVVEPGVFGLAVSEAVQELDALAGFISDHLEDPSLPEGFFRGLSQQANRRFGDAWLDRMLTLPKEGVFGDRVIEMLAVLPISAEVTTRVEARSNTREFKERYWQSVRIFFQLGDSIALTDIANLLAQDRHVDLLTTLRSQLEEQPDGVLKALLDGIFRSLRKRNADSIDHLEISALMKLLSLCRERELESLEAMASYEFPLAKQFRWSKPRYPFAIHEWATHDAKVFVQLLSYVYKTTKPFIDGAETLPQEAVANRASLAFHVLDTMRHPGLQDQQSPTEGELERWIETVREMAADYGLADLANYRIGEVLALSSDDPDDGIWPRREVREIIELFAEEQILQGISIKQFNERGLHGDGYSFYSASAVKFEMAADKLSAWPNTQKLLRDIAVSDRLNADASRTRRRLYDAMPRLR